MMRRADSHEMVASVGADLRGRSFRVPPRPRWRHSCTTSAAPVRRTEVERLIAFNPIPGSQVTQSSLVKPQNWQYRVPTCSSDLGDPRRCGLVSLTRLVG